MAGALILEEMLGLEREASLAREESITLPPPPPPKRGLGKIGDALLKHFEKYGIGEEGIHGRE